MLNIFNEEQKIANYIERFQINTTWKDHRKYLPHEHSNYKLSSDDRAQATIDIQIENRTSETLGENTMTAWCQKKALP